MANVTKLKHLEHIEDEMLNYGTEGCEAAVRFMQELTKMLGGASTAGFLQTKWDGAPSVVCGIDPASGKFFVGNKSVFNKEEPKMCFSDADIEFYYSDKPGLAEKLYAALKYFEPLGIKGVVQGDLMYTEGDKKEETIDGQQLITFRANTITYGIPVDHELGKAVAKSKMGVVFHTTYSGSNLESMTAQPKAYVNSSKDCVCIQNDTPIQDVGMPSTDYKKFEGNVQIIEQMCKKSGDFLDELVAGSGTTGDKKFYVGSFLKTFFNAEIKASRTINDPKVALKALGQFYHEKMNKEVSKMKSVQKQAERRKQLYDGLTYLEDNEQRFHAMFALYRKIQESKQLVISALDKLEKFKTYVQTENGYRVTAPEGYVLHHGGDMIKLVNRVEFSFINFTLDKSWK